MPLSDQIKSMIRSAWDDGYPLLVATTGPDGPVMGPKGSMPRSAPGRTGRSWGRKAQ